MEQSISDILNRMDQLLTRDKFEEILTNQLHKLKMEINQELNQIKESLVSIKK